MYMLTSKCVWGETEGKGEGKEGGLMCQVNHQTTKPLLKRIILTCGGRIEGGRGGEKGVIGAQ